MGWFIVAGVIFSLIVDLIACAWMLAWCLQDIWFDVLKRQGR